MQRAGERDVVDVVAGGLRERPVLAPAGHAAVDEPRVAREADVGAEPEPLHHAGPEALDQRVGLLDQRSAAATPSACLRSSATERRPRSARRSGGVAVVAAAAPGAVDAHHVGAQVGEQHRRRTAPGPMPANSRIRSPASGPMRVYCRILMKTPLCDLLGIEFPLFAFSHCRDVVAAVTNAGGFGVLGASRHTPDELELELKWIDEHVHGRPYGVDVLIPENMIGRDENVDGETLRARVPARHKEFVRELLGRYDVTVDLDDPIVAKREFPLLPAVSARLMDVAFSHPIKLIANALGLPPQSMIDRGRAQGVAVAALVGAKEHAVRQVQAGVDIIVAEGAEAGGHCGEVSTLVLVPEVIRALEPIRPRAGARRGRHRHRPADGRDDGARRRGRVDRLGVANDERVRSLAAAAGEVRRSDARATPCARRAAPANTRVSCARRGPMRGAVPDSPGPLPMPLQLFLSEPAFRRAELEASRGNRKAEALVSYYIGQGVGLLDQVKTSKGVVREFMEDFAAAAADMAQLTEE